MDIIEHHVEERGVVVFMWNRESVIWTDMSIKALPRRAQLKYISGGSPRVVTKNRCAAEQTNSDKMENVALGGATIVEFGKLANVKIPRAS